MGVRLLDRSRQGVDGLGCQLKPSKPQFADGCKQCLGDSDYQENTHDPRPAGILAVLRSISMGINVPGELGIINAVMGRSGRSVRR